MKKVRISWERPFPWTGESKPMAETEATALMARAKQKMAEKGWFDIKIEILDA